MDSFLASKCFKKLVSKKMLRESASGNTNNGSLPRSRSAHLKSLHHVETHPLGGGGVGGGLPLHATSGEKYQKELKRKKSKGKHINGGWKAMSATLFVFVHVCSSAYYYNKMKSGGSDVDALDGNDGKSETNQQTPSRYDLLSSEEDEDEQDRSLLTTKLRLELDEAKRQMLTMKEESQVMQMQLRDFQAKGMSVDRKSVV